MALIGVADRERARAFYRDVLGPVFGIGSPAIDNFGDQFPCGGGFIRLTALPDAAPGPHPVLGFQVDDAAASVAALGARGVAMLIYEGMGQAPSGLWTSPDGAAQVAWFRDSEGNLLSLTQQR
ncbi:VOC family protein [Sandarakinorhabdus rubra]|uniref:VOC family protein n=1 Tax=Sandarakinorhabdus rubra TaxID=2672568 RepID=UPI0013DA8845|nr:VOC family protein [Sandarakinorhabdus rubra]